MDISYADLIEQEQAKIALLRAKIEECQRRIDVLRSFLNTDELDTLLTKSLLPESVEREAASHARLDVQPRRASSPGGAQDPRRRLSDDVLKILRFIGSDGKTLNELESFCKSKGFRHNRGSLRSMISTYKLKHGFIDSEDPGIFRLTERALTFLNKNYPLAKSETPSVGAEGVSDFTKAAVQGGPESDGLI